MSSKPLLFVMAHKEPLALRQTVTALRDTYDGPIWVNIDPKVKEQNDLTVYAERADAYLTRYPVTYAAWEAVLCYLRAIREALTFDSWTHFINLDGATLPLWSMSHIVEQLGEGKSYFYRCTMGQWPLLRERIMPVWSNDELTSRSFREPLSYGVQGDSGQDALWDLMDTLEEAPVFYGCCPAFHALSREACQYLVSDELAPMRAFFHHVYCPDESFTATALMNSPLRDTVVNRNTMWCSWEPGALASRVITPDVVPTILAAADAGPFWFARKFDTGPAAQAVLERLRKLGGKS